MLFFIRFTSTESQVVSLNLGKDIDAEILVVKADDPITTGNVYAITAYDNFAIRKFAEQHALGVQAIDMQSLLSVDGFPQFRTQDMPLSADDLKPTEEKSFYQVLVVNGLGICINDILYRGAAWRTLRGKMNEDEIAFNMDFSASMPFVSLSKLLLENGASEKVLFGPILLDTILRYDFVINESALASLKYSHDKPFSEQVSSVVDSKWSIDHISEIRLPELIEDPELLSERIDDIFGEGGFVLVNGAGDFPFNHIPMDPQIKIVKALLEKGYKVATMGSIIEHDSVINVNDMATSLGVLDIITKKARAVITSNSPSTALAAKNSTPLVCLTVAAAEGIYLTDSSKQRFITVADTTFFKNINQVEQDDLRLMSEKWETFDESSVMAALLEVIDAG